MVPEPRVALKGEFVSANVTQKRLYEQPLAVAATDGTVRAAACSGNASTIASTSGKNDGRIEFSKNKWEESGDDTLTCSGDLQIRRCI
jgi:hypothetical protein